jgi:hypothetical protein
MSSLRTKRSPPAGMRTSQRFTSRRSTRGYGVNQRARMSTFLPARAHSLDTSSTYRVWPPVSVAPAGGGSPQ